MQLDKQKALRELGIPEEMYDELLRDFIQQSEEPLKQLEGLVLTGDFEEIRKAAHFIKGSAGNMRVEEMYSIAKEVEFAAKDAGDKSTIGENIAKLRSAFEELKKSIP